ncbi:MAG: helix-turn-helix transcriptional regulator [Dehalococcoidales bacterium]|nr:helix-turn-helix transcriptional regulator [Dehalococcoidales bacterium]
MIRTGNNLGKLIKQKRVSVPLTLCELGSSSGVSPSHLGRIERGERLPSARVLRKIAKPLGFKEEELFMIAGFLSSPSSDQKNPSGSYHYSSKLDPFVANVLSQEPAEVQRAVIGILSMLKVISKTNKNKAKPNN